MFDLKGQVAIITGGARGIGEGICDIFCKAGATVALWDVIDEGAATAEEISASGGSIFFQKQIVGVFICVKSSLVCTRRQSGIGLDRRRSGQS